MFIFQIKNSQLGAVAKAELVQDRAQVVSHRSFAQVQVLSNFFVAHSLGDQGNDFQLSGTDVVGFPGEGFLTGQKIRKFCGDFVSVDRLSGEDSFQRGDNAVIISPELYAILKEGQVCGQDISPGISGGCN